MDDADEGRGSGDGWMDGLLICEWANGKLKVSGSGVHSVNHVG